MVVHDLRSPLSNVLGALRMVQEVPPGRGLDEQESELVQFGVRSCLKMRTLIDEYLQVVRLESGTMPVRMACVDVVCLVREGVAEFKEAAHAAGIEFRLEAPKTQFCNADPELLIRALQNLLDNAMKHTPRGGGVTVSVRALGREVLIGVSDTGRGIAKRDLPHIFDRYYQGSSPGRKGLGLGLTFCREALRSLGGRMTVESEEGRGAAFTMVLPGSREEPGG